MVMLRYEEWSILIWLNIYFVFHRFYDLFPLFSFTSLEGGVYNITPPVEILKYIFILNIFHNLFFWLVCRVLLIFWVIILISLFYQYTMSIISYKNCYSRIGSQWQCFWTILGVWNWEMNIPSNYLRTFGKFWSREQLKRVLYP